MPLGDFKLEMNLITLHQGENKGHNLTETQSRENLLTVFFLKIARMIWFCNLNTTVFRFWNFIFLVR